MTIRILPQPDDTTCGPTCLHAVYRYYGDDVTLDDVIAQVTPLPSGGTLAVNLAVHALARGYRAALYTYNLQMFDPTWWTPGAEPLPALLAAQRAAKPDPKLHLATDAYAEFLAAGGHVHYRELSPELLAELLADDGPVLTGLSATYLYGCARERGADYDAVGGQPTGHFVVLQTYDADDRSVFVADPLGDNPRYESHHYRVGVDRLLGAILLGVVTYDANLLILRPA
jgi:hypothetical protein